LRRKGRGGKGYILESAKGDANVIVNGGDLELSNKLGVVDPTALLDASHIGQEGYAQRIRKHSQK